MNRQDVILLNNAITGVGQSFAQNRRETTDAAYRQQLLDREIARQNAAQSHYDAMNQNEQDANKVRASAAADKDDQQTFQTLTELNAAGALANRDKVNAWLSSHPKWGKVGLALQEPTQKPPPQVGQSSAAQALKIADDYDSKADEEEDPDKQQQLRDNAKILRDSAKQMAMPKQNPADYDVIEETTPGTKSVEGAPGQAAQPGGFMGIGAKPAVAPVPGIPGIPTVRRRTHVPRGTIPTASTGSTGGKPITDRSGKSWLYKGAMPDPTQDKNPANWEAQ